jgi:hypothetical protein
MDDAQSAKMHLYVKRGLLKIDPDGSGNARVVGDLMDAGLLSGIVPRTMIAGWFALISTWTTSATSLGMPIDAARRWRDAVISESLLAGGSQDPPRIAPWTRMFEVREDENDVRDALGCLESMLRISLREVDALCLPGRAGDVVRLMTEIGHRMMRELSTPPS